ncbi:MAG TPA: acyl-homoserine-lactone synthase [Polyangiales bacterium]|nr:acyl-homoserine-lactone synthase [Polyangiales bacterium]
MDITVGELPPNRHCEAFRLRHQVLCESLGELPPSADAQERDAWDDCSLHVHASIGERLVAYVRIILAGHGPFLMESLGYSLDALPGDLRTHVGEPSRIIVDPKLSRSLRVVHDPFSKLVAAAYQLSLERGVVGWVFDTDAHFVRSLRQRGWPLVQFGDPIEHHGVKRAPFFVRLSEVESAQFAHRAHSVRPKSRRPPAVEPS